MKTYDFARIQARPFPTVAELKNPNIYGYVRYVLNVSDKASSTYRPYSPPESVYM